MYRQVYKPPEKQKFVVPDGNRYALSNPRGSSFTGPKWRIEYDIADRHNRLYPSLFLKVGGRNRQSGGFQGHNGPTAGMLYKGRLHPFLEFLKMDRPNNVVSDRSVAARDALYKHDYLHRGKAKLHDGDYGLFAAENPRIRSGRGSVASYSFFSGNERTPIFGSRHRAPAFNRDQPSFPPNRPPIWGAPREGRTGLFPTKPPLTYGAPRTNVPQATLDDMALRRARTRTVVGLPIAEIPVVKAEDIRTGIDYKSLAMFAGVVAVIWLMRGRLK